MKTSKMRVRTMHTRPRRHTRNTLGVAPAVVAAVAPIVKQGIEKRNERKEKFWEYQRTHKITPFKVISGVVIAGILTYTGVKTYQYIRGQKLIKKVSDKHVQAAQMLYNVIPSSAKRQLGFSDFIIPFKIVDWGIEQIKSLWQETNINELLDVAKFIHNNELKTKKVYKYFKYMYKVDVANILNETLPNDKLQLYFETIENGGNKTTTENGTTLTADGKEKGTNKDVYLVCVNSKGLRVRETPEINDPHLIFLDLLDNIAFVAKNGDVIGKLASTEKVIDKEDSDIRYYKVKVHLDGNPNATCYVSFGENEGYGKLYTLEQYKKEFNTDYLPLGKYKSLNSYEVSDGKSGKIGTINITE